MAVCLFLLPPVARADLRTIGYYPGYRQTAMPASEVDFTALTHVIHFALLANPDGTLNSSDNGITVSRSADVVTRAHAVGTKVLISVAGGQTDLLAASSTTNLPLFINNLVNFMVARGYDGIDLDWEPLDASDTARFTALVNGLRTALDNINPRPMLTAAVYSQPSLIGSVASKLDQVNIMTYGMSGAYGGWVTWFNCPLYNGGYTFPSTGGLVPSIDAVVTSFLNAGVPAQKLAIGVGFYGRVWKAGAGTSTGGASLPRQTWTNAPTTSAASFDSIMSTYYQPGLYHWDTNAQVPYLSIDNAGSTNDMFISYDDERSCQTKVSFARNRGLGGIMIWELGQGYRPSKPVGQREPLLQAIKQALTTPGMTAITKSGTNINLSFSSLPLASYRIQWTTNLTSGLWNNLTNNITGDGTVLQVADPGAVGKPQRFYRVQTPP